MVEKQVINGKRVRVSATLMVVDEIHNSRKNHLGKYDALVVQSSL
jgi:hypothetical protein